MKLLKAISSKVLSLAFVLCVITVVANAQTGTISGKIIDAATGETLPGALAVVEGTNIGASADFDGNFTINKVPVGTHRVTIKCISYNGKVIGDVNVADGQVTNLTTSLESANNELGEVVIEATIEKETVSALLIQQKTSVTVQDGISAETIKKTPDRSAGDALKRVSGTSIQDNKYVIVRGLSDRYNMAMVNGAPLPSTETDRRAFSFDLFPTNMIDNLVIVKTATPDLPSEFAGGVVQVNTRSLPEENFVSVNANVGYNTITTFKSFARESVKGSTDFLGIDDGTRAFPSDFPSTSKFRGMLPDDQIKYAKKFQNDFATDYKTASPNQSYQLSIGQRKKIGSQSEVGGLMSLSYNANNRFQEIIRTDFDQGTTTPNYRYSDKQYLRSNLCGALVNLSGKINNNNRITLQNSFTVNSDNQVTERTGYRYEVQDSVRSSALWFNSNRLLISQLNAEHLFPKSQLKLTWGAGLGNISRTVPNFRKLSYNKSTGEDFTDSVYRAQLPSVPDPNNNGRFYSNLKENQRSANVNASLPIFNANNDKPKQSLKVGAYTAIREREFNARNFGYIIRQTSSVNRDSVQQLQPGELHNPGLIDAQKGITIDEVSNNGDSYKAKSNLSAAYLMLDNNITSKLRVVWGVRYENYRQQIESSDIKGNYQKVADTTFGDFFPSLNITYGLNAKTNLRFSASRTTSRPEFREIAPFSFYDFDNARNVVGNPKLLRSNITNLDLRYEIYPGFGQLLAVSLFYKDFTNPIESIVSSSGAGSRTVGYKNIKQSQNYGIELELRQRFSFAKNLWKGFDDILFTTNLSMVQSIVNVRLNDIVTTPNASDSIIITRPLQGQSPYLINIGLGYNSSENGWSANIFYNQIGRRITEVGIYKLYEDIYENPRPLIDLQIAKKIFKNGEIKLNVTDLLHRDAIFYQDLNANKKYDEKGDNVIFRRRVGSTISLGFSYKF